MAKRPLNDLVSFVVRVKANGAKAAAATTEKAGAFAIPMRPESLHHAGLPRLYHRFSRAFFQHSSTRMRRR